MHLSQLQLACAFGPCALAYKIRDAPLNQTTSLPTEPTQIESLTDATGSSLSSSSLELPFFKPHLESAETGFDTQPTSIRRNVQGPGTTTPPQDVGSIIQSFLTTMTMTALPQPTVHDETTADGWETDSQDPSVPQSERLHPPHLEASESGFTGPTSTGRQVPGDVRPGTTAATHRNPPVVTPPTITRNGVTVKPVPVTSTSIWINIDGAPLTTEVIDYQFVADSSILEIGSPITVNGEVISITTDSSGNTLLVAGDTTTTLADSSQDVEAAQITGASDEFSISTTVVQGTTKYVFAGQTLAPGQPVTVGDTPISITTSDGNTILVVGTITTTLANPPKTEGFTDLGPSTAPTPGGFATSIGNANPASPTPTAGSGKSRTWDRILTTITGMTALLWNFG